eukprot:TRINITY_DN34155_c0_g1_i1.p1 TRINITY_DN34155_c0_g1~~TRINITY_DN34155_c0_g1_i1.p1  ORF type:complete len:397 (-),score=76.61 TRINITY_DN34155_c0_g1_i1:237-1427(-)
MIFFPGLVFLSVLPSGLSGKSLGLSSVHALAPDSNKSADAALLTTPTAALPQRSLVRRESIDNFDAEALEGLGDLLISSGSRERSDGADDANYGTGSLHFCTMVSGKGPLSEFDLFLSSLNTNGGDTPRMFHILTDVTTKESLTDILKAKAVKAYELHVINTTEVRQQALRMKLDVWQHWEGHFGLVWPLSRIYLQDMFPKVDRCISHDTDLFVGKRLDELWKVFGEFREEALLAATWRPALKFGNHLNAGVLLLDLAKMRQTRWKSALREAYRTCARGGSKVRDSGVTEVRYPEQEIFEASLHFLSGLQPGSSEMPSTLHKLARGWNLEFCQNAESPQRFYGYCDAKASGHFLGIMHFNCCSDGYVENPWYTAKAFKEWWAHGGQKCVGDVLHVP